MMRGCTVSCTVLPSSYSISLSGSQGQKPCGVSEDRISKSCSSLWNASFCRFTEHSFENSLDEVVPKAAANNISKKNKKTALPQQPSLQHRNQPARTRIYETVASGPA